MNLMFSYLFFLSLVIFISIIFQIFLIRIIKKINLSFKLNKILSSINVDYFKQQLTKTLIIFTSYSDENNVQLIQNVSDMYNEYNIIIIYNAPAWKGNRLVKQVDSNIKLHVDERGDFSDYLNINIYPFYFLLDKNLEVITKGVWPPISAKEKL